MAKYKPNLKVLIFDIEIVGGGFGADGTTLFTVSWKFVGEKKTYSLTLPIDFPKEFEKDHFNDKPLLKKLHAIFEEADITVAHFGSRFDMPYLRAKMLKHRLSPLKDPFMIDTWKVAKYQLKLSNNRLDTLIRFLGTPTHKTWFDKTLWKRAEHGDIKCAKMINDHCIKDVKALEEVYHVIKDIIPNHPVKHVVEKGDVCPSCQGKLEHKGQRYTKTMRHIRYRCRKCGSSFKTKNVRWSS